MSMHGQTFTILVKIHALLGELMNIYTLYVESGVLAPDHRP